MEEKKKVDLVFDISKCSRVALEVFNLIGCASWIILGIAMVVCFILDAVGMISFG